MRSSSSRKHLRSCLLRGRFLSTSSVLRPPKACLAGYPMATTSSWVTTATTAATAGPGDLSRRETSSARSSTYSNDVVSRAIVLAFALLLPAGERLRSAIDFARHVAPRPGTDLHGEA